jgi:DNA-binding MarR family transcriptional regulator
VLGGVARAAHHCAGASVNRDLWWRQEKRHVPLRAAPVFELVNASFKGVPDFLKEAASQRLTDELDTILAVPDPAFYENLAFYDQEPELPRIVAELRDGGTRELRRFTDGVWALFRTCIAPHWPDIQRHLQADIAHRARTAAEAGVGAMLNELHPQLAWHEEGILRYAEPEWDGTFWLGGRGLELRPNFFLQSGVMAIPAEHRPTALSYPISARPSGYTSTRQTDGLASLIGSARARALRAIGQGSCNTRQLAERLCITSPSASSHATALRTAGAITTEREGRQVRHTLTSLGRDLLYSNPVAHHAIAEERQ